MTRLTELRDRIAGATGPDRELDRAIWDTFIVPLAPATFSGDDAFGIAPLQGQGTDFTDSVDLVLSLATSILPASKTWKAGSHPSSGWRISLYRGLTPAAYRLGMWEAAVHLHAQEPNWQHAKTPALALLAALLTALAETTDAEVR